ncbi:MAG: PAS domain S-box protein [Desulfovibrionaceae bacterium]|nr:PAS domain S-box protein [Desulfovibrionaceae bacterium]
MKRKKNKAATEDDLRAETERLRLRVAELEDEQADSRDRVHERILRHLPLPVFVLGEDQAFTYANKAACGLTKRTRREIIGRKIPDLLPEEVAPSPGHEHRAAAGGEVRDIHCRGRSQALNILKQTCRDPATGRGLTVVAVQNVTARKRAEQALEESERRYKLLAENSADLIWTVTPPETISYISPAVFNLLGYIQEEVLSKNLTEILTPASKKRFQGLLAKDLPETGARRLMLDFKAKAGSIVWTETLITVLRDESGRATGLLGVSRDMSERRLMRKALKASEDTAQAMLEATVDAVMLTEPDGTILACNRAMAERFGAAANDLIGKNAFELIPSDQVRKKRKIVNELMRTKRFQRLVSRRDGKDFETSIYPVLDGTEISRIAFFSREITKQLRVMEKLRLSEFSVEHCALATLLLCPEAKILAVNQAACRDLGLPKKRLLGRSFRAFCPAEEAWPDIWAELKKDRHLVREFNLRAANGRAFPAEIDFNYLKYKGKEYCFSCVRDISRRSQALRRVSESEARFRAIFEAMSSGVAVYEAAEDGSDFVFKDFNPAAERIEGLDRDSVLGRGLSEVFPGTSDMGMLEVLKRVHESARPEHFPAAFYSDARISGWRENFVYKLPSGEVVAVYDDVSKRIRAEAALRAAESKYRGIFENAMDGIFQTTPEGVFLSANPAMARIFGYQDPVDLIREVSDIGRQLYADPRDRAEILELLDLHDEVKGYEFRARRRDGGLIWVSLDVRAVRGGDGRIARFEGLVKDITERKLAKEQLKKSLAEKETLLQEVYHRVKNNLQIISSLVDMAGRRASSPEVMANCRDIRAKIQAMSLIHAQAYQSKRFDRINMSAYIKNLYRNLALMYETMDSGTVTPRFRLDDVHLSMNQAIPVSLVINEALTNVFKHAFPGREGGEVEIGLARQPDGSVRLWVSEQGRGLPKDFDFEAAESMGLKLIKVIVREQLLGEVAIHSDGVTELRASFKLDEPGVGDDERSGD